MREDYVGYTVLRLAHKGKIEIANIISTMLQRIGAEFLHDDLFYIIMELSFNALKANYRFDFMLDEYRASFSDDDETEKAVEELLTDQLKYEEFFTSIDQDELTKRIREIFSLENKATKIIEKIDHDNRVPTPLERERLTRYLYFANKLYHKNIKVNVRLSYDEESIIVEIINDAPITYSGLKKIYSKRMNFKSYVDRGEEHMFYLEHLDATESAGYGAAMIDARLRKMGLDPFTSFEIVRLGTKTAATISIPLDKVVRE